MKTRQVGHGDGAAHVAPVTALVASQVERFLRQEGVRKILTRDELYALDAEVQRLQPMLEADS